MSAGAGGAFTLRAGRVVDEVIDGEVIIIQLERGTYFSLGGSGAQVWALLKAGADRDSVIAVLEAGHSSEPGEVDGAVDALLDELVGEEVLDRGEADGGFQLPAPPQGELPQFSKPKLEKYTDMEDFLLLDPVHEVAETGWPRPPQA